MPEFEYPYDAKLPPIKNAKWEFPLLTSPRLLAIQLAALAAFFALANATVYPVTELSRPVTFAETWSGFTFGLIGAEAGLLAIGAVLGPGKWPVRHLSLTFLAVLWMLSWFLGLGVSCLNRRSGLYAGELTEILAAVFVIPLMFCACELPLWFFRGLLRWRIEPVIQSGDAPRPPQLSIAGILIATSAVAIAMASVRLGGSLIGNNMREAEWWGACGIAVAFSGGISLVTLPVAVWATLRSPSLLAGIIVMVASLFAVAVALICIIGGLTGDWPRIRLEVWLPLGGVVFGFACGLLGTLTMVRAGGYRLYWGRELSPGTITVSASAVQSASPASPRQ